MARRKKGLDLSGWLVVDKPLGIGSTQVVAKARWALNAQKAGHSGTLDPLATGVLAIAFGEATKTIPYATDSLKGYRFTVRLGVATSTDDGEGGPVATSETRPSDAEIEAALPEFTGDIEQVPPQFSAVKVDGARAYDLARSGEVMELAARPLWVESLTLIGRPDADHAEFEMICGKGGYVRSIARDLGARLGCFGHVAALRRIFTGPFHEDDAVPFADLDALRDDPEAAARLMPLAAGLSQLPEVRLTEAGAADLRQGRAGAAAFAPDDLNWGDLAWASRGGAAVAVGTWEAGALTPARVFQKG